MKNNLYKFLICILLLFWSDYLQAQKIEWMRGINGNGLGIYNSPTSITIDAMGHIYTVGNFYGTRSFYINGETFNLTSTSGSLDVFVCKLDTSGNFIWAKAMGGDGEERVTSMAVDASGNVYTTGYFTGTADFDPNAGVANLTSVGGSDIFISKLDASGNFVWAKSMGGTWYDFSNGIALDASGNVYTTGNFVGTVDFDPNTGTANLTSVESDDIFIQKLDPSGNFVWAKAIGGINYELASSIAVDAIGNVYTTGYFTGTTDFDPGVGIFNLSVIGYKGMFISKLDASGNFIWAKAMLGGGDFEVRSIDLDAFGNVYTTGHLSGGIDFDPNAGVVNLTSIGGYDIFVQKLDASGNFVWAKSMGGVSNDFANSISVDASGNVYTTGSFKETADFDPGVGIFNLINANGYESSDIFFSKLDASGNFIWARRYGSIDHDDGRAIVADAVGNAYATGTLRNIFLSTIFVTKLSTCPTVSIITTSLPVGMVGTMYSGQISQTGLTGVPQWSVINGSLPTGLSLNSSTGQIAGTPVTSGTFNFTVQVVEDGNNCPKTQDFSIVVNCPTIMFNNTTFTNATVNVAYTLNVSATTTIPALPLTYSISPTLPAGLSLNPSTGQITGTPTTATPMTTYTIRANMSGGSTCVATQTYNFLVACPAVLTFNNTTSINAIVGANYLLDASATSVPTVPLTYTVSPVLPIGLNLNSSTGQITGTPTSVTPMTTYTVRANMSGGSTCIVTQAYNFAVNCPNISFSNTTVTNGIVGTNFSLDVSVIGNTQSINYSVSPSLPAGISLNGIGIISGVSNTEVPLTTYTVTATQGSCTKSQDYTFAINCPNISINPVSLTSTLLSLPYTQTLEEIGLLGTPIWSIDSGSLPMGLNLDASTGVISGTPITEGIYDFTILVADGICSKTHSYTLEIVRGVVSFEVFPNPTEKLLIIKSSQKSNYQYQVSDLSGRKVREGNFYNSNRMTIDISSLEKGIYIVEMITPVSNNVFKIVKL